MDKKLKDSIALRLYEDKITDKAFESLKQHNHFNRGFKKDFAQEMIIQFYEIEEDKLDSIYEQDGYSGICSFYFKMCIFQLLARNNKMGVKWLGYKNMFVNTEYLDGLCEFGTDRLNTNMLDMEDYNEQLYNNEELVDEENNEEEDTDIDEIYETE